MGSTMAPVGATLFLVRGSALYQEIRAGLVVAPVCFNQDVKALVPTARIVPKFLTYTLLGRAQDLLKLVSTAGNSAGVLDTKLVQSFKISLPPIPEQSAIAEALSDVDGLLGALEALIVKKRAIKQAAMQQLLTGETRLPGFSGEWDVTRLEDVATFHKGKMLPKSSLLPSGAEPCIHYGELFTRYPETIRQIISRTNKSGNHFHSSANDVLMPTSDVTPNGLARASCITMDGVILGGDILVIRANSDLIFGPFLAYLIRHSQEEILQLVTGTTVFHIYAADMKKFTFPRPLMDEQRRVVAVLDDMDAEITALEARLSKARQLKRGMMQQLLTGRVRLVRPTLNTESFAC